jgi:drug/metabolite transporter (DMT)-like permease
MKTAVVLALAILAQAIGNVFLTRGMKAVAATVEAGGGVTSTLSHALDVASEAAQRPEVWIGTVLLIVFFALCSAALSWADLSFVLPATAAGYVLNVAAGRYFLHEDVTTARWVGALIIMLGVVFVSRSGERTTPAAVVQAGAAEDRARS